MTVIATSSVVSAESVRRGLTNLRLGMLLQVGASAAALAGGIVVAMIPHAILHDVLDRDGGRGAHHALQARST
jgi:uncharacterized membrane protein YfcA